MLHRGPRAESRGLRIGFFDPPVLRLSMIVTALVVTILVACESPGFLTPIAQPTSSLLAPTLTPTAAQPNVLPTPLLGPTRVTTPTLPAGQVDYHLMIRQINALLAQVDYDVGVAFVDIQTGQSISLGREGRFHAMSTFKGPLAAFYLWLIEQGEIEEGQGDHFFIEDMLTWSSNSDTTCIFKRVGGIAGFNDWLAEQGFSRKNNYVYSWHSWVCQEHGSQYAPAPDDRYRYGNTELGLPGGAVLLQCPDGHIPCDKAFSPIELVQFYARLYLGKVLEPADTRRWLKWMEKPLPITSMFDSLPPEAEKTVHAYTKNGFHPADNVYPMNFYHEAGILETPYGAFALAVFMQNNPEWRGTDIHGQIGALAYLNFVAAHGHGD